MRQANLAGLPATVLSVAECDPLRDHGSPYAEGLRHAGVPVTLHDGLGLIDHSFDLIGSAPGVRAELDRVLASARDVLERVSSDVHREATRAD